MKIGSLFIGVSLMATMAVGVGTSLTIQANAGNVQAAPSEYYLCGSFASGYSNYDDLGNWDNSNNSYPVSVDSSSPTVFSFKKYESAANHGDEFKFVILNSWDGALGAANLAGTAASCFGNSGGNLYCNYTGVYNVYISSGTIYIDYGELCYTGSDNGFTDGTRVSVDGQPTQLSLTATKKFRFKQENTWDHTFGWSQLSSDWYHCFGNADDDDNNIYVNVTSTYSVSISSNTHTSISISITSADGGTVYVLDLNGNLLNTRHNAYVYNSSGAKTDWPGASMNKTTNTSNIYEYTYIAMMETIIFNAKNGDDGTQNYDQSLSGKNGKCLILTWDYDETAGKWSSETWFTLEAARFVDKYMKFETAHEDAGDGSGYCKSQGWYSAAKTAYASLSTDAKKDVSGFKRIADRLAAWAKANDDTFTITSGVGSFSRAVTPVNQITGENSFNPLIIIVVASLTSLTAIGLLVYIKRRKSN